MVITDLKVIRTATSERNGTNWLFVKIETDSGIYGIGEGSLQYKDAGLTAELEEFKKFIVGKDPFQIEHIWTSLHRRVTWTGGAVTMSAISAIDLALWDIKGKALGVPVYSIFRGEIGAVDRYLSDKGRLSLIESIEDVNSKINPVKREKTEKAKFDDLIALKQIIDAIEDLLK